MNIINYKISSWSKFNPRSDRKNYTWFRFENIFFTDTELFTLGNDAKILLIFMLCEASKKSDDGLGRLNVGMVTAMLGFNEKRVAELIQEIEITSIATFDNQKTPEAAKCLPTNERTNVTNVTNERTNDTPSSDLTPPDIFNLWNDTIHEFESGLSKAKAMNPKRRSSVNSCIKTYSEMRTRSDWINYFEKINQNQFLVGNNDRGWKADFDWSINKNNLLKVIEGRYDSLGSHEQVKINNMAKRENPYAK